MYQQPYHMGNFPSQPGGQPSFGMSRSPFKKIYKQCMKNRNQHVQLILADGKTFSGFIEYVDQQNVYFAIPFTESNPQSEDRKSDSQYNVTGYQIYRCMFPLHAVMGINPAF